MVLYTSTLFRWLQRKRYQYEVTFSLYMLTPTEKFVFNSVLFLVLSMIIIAASLYLPEHIATIAGRASFYWAGEESSIDTKPLSAAASLASTTAKATINGVKNAGKGVVTDRLKDL